jgi:hypothetical protein
MNPVNIYKKDKILIFCMIFAANAAFCQHSVNKNGSAIDFLTVKTTYRINTKINSTDYFHHAAYKKPALIQSRKETFIYINPVSCSTISADYYTRNFGFFCKKELQFEKATKIPLRFRLGSLQYNDYLEQKPNAVNKY